jgi:hypothetical protein
MGDVEQLIADVHSAKAMVVSAEETEKKAIADTIEARKLYVEAVKKFDATVDGLHKEWTAPYSKGNA